MALAQQPDILLLDELTTYLDIACQLDVLELIARLNRRHGRTVVVVLHDLNLACRYADHLVAMRDGAIVSACPPCEVMTTDCVRDKFGVYCVVIDDLVSGTPLVVPLGSGQRDATVTAPRGRRP
jgi:iron complex transport system ATP-binding protein